MKRSFFPASILLVFVLLCSLALSGCSVTKKTDDETPKTSAQTTATPTTTAAPETTAESATTAKPTTAAEPASTAAPETTAEPISTSAPATAAEPASTVAPVTTASPETTAEPISTAVPATTVEPYVPTPYEPQYRPSYEELVEDGKKQLGAYEIVAPSRAGVSYAHPIPLSLDPGYANTREELIEIVDHYAFYRESGFSVTLGYPVAEVEAELNYCYFNSGLLPSLCSIFGTLTGNVLTVQLEFYPETYLVTPQTTVYAEILGAENDPPAGIDTLPGLDLENGVSVWDSEQACYALSHGYAIAPIPDSPAAELITAAQEILSEIIDDDMTEWQVAYRIYHWLMENSPYDYAGDKWAGNSLDRVYEPDMLPARLESFRAEGPILYGVGVCFGYAKAATLLLGLEGFDVRRVVSFSEQYLHHDVNPGRAWEYGGTIQVHSYNYIRIDGYDYLFDLSFAKAGNRTVNDSVAGQDVNVAITRDFCLGLSKSEQATIYSEFPDDPYSKSSAYNPGSYHYLSNLTYDGEHPLLLSSPAEAQAYYAYLLENVFVGEPICRTATLFYAGVDVSSWYDQYQSQLYDFLNATGVPCSYPIVLAEGERTGAGVMVILAFGR